jgi:hypothetical protein
MLSSIGAVVMASTSPVRGIGAGLADFGLVPLKQEGASIPYDPFSYERRAEKVFRALAKSIMQTKEVVAKNVLEKMFYEYKPEEGNEGLAAITR